MRLNYHLPLQRSAKMLVPAPPLIFGTASSKGSDRAGRRRQVDAFDAAAAPLGTDDEATGTPQQL